MEIYTATQFRKKLHQIINNKNAPVTYIMGKDCQKVLIDAEEYESMNETEYLYSIPGMVESILEASKEAAEGKGVDWREVFDK